MGFVSRHLERDLSLPKHRDTLLKNALKDLIRDLHVLAIYLGGSLAKGNDDDYSDIDLHIIVAPEKKSQFIREKRNRARNWGEVLFYEGTPGSPVVVTHYDGFVKIDSWYHSPEEMAPSIWLKGLEALYDPHHIIGHVIEESSKLVYKPSKEEIMFWREKMFAFVHETYRSVMRNELYDALSNLDRIRWLIVSGWYMEERMDVPYGVWSKLEGKRSKLTDWQKSLLMSWDCNRHSSKIMKTMVSIFPEFLRLNKQLCNLVGLEINEHHIKSVIAMAY